MDLAVFLGTLFLTEATAGSLTVDSVGDGWVRGNYRGHRSRVQSVKRRSEGNLGFPWPLVGLKAAPTAAPAMVGGLPLKPSLCSRPRSQSGVCGGSRLRLSPVLRDPGRIGGQQLLRWSWEADTLTEVQGPINLTVFCCRRSAESEAATVSEFAAELAAEVSGRLSLAFPSLNPSQ